MIKVKEEINVNENGVDITPIKLQVKKLKPGSYALYICDKKKSRKFPQNKYLFGVVLKMISKETDIDSKDLYKIFETKFAPEKVVIFEEEEFIVRDMKRCSSAEMDAIILKIIDYAREEYGIHIPPSEDMISPECQELYVGAYNDCWEEGF